MIGHQLMQAVLQRVAERHCPGVRLVQATYHSRSLCLYTCSGSTSSAHQLANKTAGWLTIIDTIQAAGLRLRGYPKTFSHCRSEITQPPCGNETQGDRRERASSA
jgi:hypothetical protein